MLLRVGLLVCLVAIVTPGCSEKSSFLQFANDNHTGNLYVTISTPGQSDQTVGPLPTNGDVMEVKTQLMSGQVFTFTAGVNSTRGAAVSCTASEEMLPKNDGFGSVIVTALSSGQAIVFCAEHWQ